MFDLIIFTREHTDEEEIQMMCDSYQDDEFYKNYDGCIYLPNQARILSKQEIQAICDDYHRTKPSSTDHRPASRREKKGR